MPNLCLRVFLFFWVGLGLAPGMVRAHQLEAGQGVVTLSPDFVWILELEMNLTRYIQSNPELADTVRPRFRELEKSEGLTEENFAAWESLFLNCEEQFRRELKVIENGAEIESYELWFSHPSELPESAFLTMLEEGLHIKVYGTGKLSGEDARLQFRFPLDVGEVALTSVQPQTQWVITGEVSAPISLSGPGSAQAGEAGYSSSVLRYLRIGFYHILPLGLDHILFVVGLFLLSARMRPLLIQVSCFTVAHTLTLGLSIYGVVSLPSGLVEPLIALSIVLVAVENILTDHIHPWRPVIVFFFGLLHGLGFAGVLGEIGLPPDEFLSALIFFNVGVELGQLAVVAGAFLLIGFFRNRNWYRSYLTIPLSACVGAVGLYWTVQRIFF